MAEPSPDQLKMGAAALEAALRGLTTPGRGIAGHQGLPGVMGPEAALNGRRPDREMRDFKLSEL